MELNRVLDSHLKKTREKENGDRRREDGNGVHDRSVTPSGPPSPKAC